MSLQKKIPDQFIGYMPQSDLDTIDVDVLTQYATHADWLRENALWSVPEVLFSHYVAHYRINNEDISDCRALFCKELWPRVQGMSMVEAALEANIWCAEHVTYQLTSSDRTASPRTVYHTGYGRCGEQSGFLVAALRSIGIPARQIYVPRWSHCDDNHAWVEAWCDGEWHFLGACEPEPVLDKGWFNDAAARAMLVHSRCFGEAADQPIISSDAGVMLLNQTARYAPSRKFTVLVEENNAPIVGAYVYFMLINAAESYSIATTTTDSNGQTALVLGYGDILIRVLYAGRFLEKRYNTSTADTIIFDFSDAVTKMDEGVQYFVMHAPKDISVNSRPLTTQQKITRTKTLEQTNTARNAYCSSLYDESAAQEAAQYYPESDLVLSLLREARGNFSQMHRFLSTDCAKDKLVFLQSLDIKDYHDSTAEMLTQRYHSYCKAISSPITEQPSTDCTLTLLSGTERFTYGQNWSIGVLQNGNYITLSPKDPTFVEGRCTLGLNAGSYRVVTANRVPNGNLFVKYYPFTLTTQKEATLSIFLYEVDIQDMLTHITFDTFEVKQQERTMHISTLLANKASLIIWLEEGCEPTEHILNELIDGHALFDKSDIQIVFLAKTDAILQNATFLKASSLVKNSILCYADFADTVPYMGRRMFVDPEKLPLTVVAQDGCTGIFAASGYNVGIVEMMAKIIHTIPKKS